MGLFFRSMLGMLVLGGAVDSQGGPWSRLNRSFEPLPDRSWVVDLCGNGDFLDLPRAVQVAAPGDLLLVCSTGALEYSGFRTSKGLTIVGTPSASTSCAPSNDPPLIGGSIVLHDIPNGQEMVMRGLSLRLDAPDGQVLEVLDCDGVVWIEDCDLEATRDLGIDEGTLTGCNGLLVRNSQRFVMTRSSIRGGGTTVTGTALGVREAFRVQDASVFGYRNDVVGLPPLTSLFGGAYGVGGIGLQVEGASFLYDAGSAITGGTGSPPECGFLTCNQSPADGGDGLSVSATSVALLLDTALAGGPGYSSIQCGVVGPACPASDPGQPLAGLAETIPLPARTCQVESPVEAGASYRLTITGEPGETAVTAHSTGAAAAYVPLFFGAQHVGFPVSFQMRGVIPASGVLEVDVAVPPFGVEVPFHREFVQALVFDSFGAYLTNGSILVVVP